MRICVSLTMGGGGRDQEKRTLKREERAALSASAKISRKRGVGRRGHDGFKRSTWEVKIVRERGPFAQEETAGRQGGEPGLPPSPCIAKPRGGEKDANVS